MNEKSLTGIGRGASTVTSQHTGMLEQCFEHVGPPLKMGSDSICLCYGPRPTKTQNTNLTGSRPHKWGGHITHQMCSSTFDAGKPHVQFERRTEASAQARLLPPHRKRPFSVRSVAIALCPT